MMKRNRVAGINAAGILAALIIFLVADTALFLMAGMPRIENITEQRKWEGLDLLRKHGENPDMIGWLQVDGTTISCPVMRGEAYLYRNFRGDYDASGSLFVEDDWTEEDICTLIYGHNMWMYGTMFNPLHSFAENEFFTQNREIRFYAVKDTGVSAEKRTYEIIFCIKTRVDEWNYASCRYICSGKELSAFAEECGSRAVQRWESAEGAMSECGELIVLSTCSYHVRGGKGRLLLVGELTDRTEQTRIDADQQ